MVPGAEVLADTDVEVSAESAQNVIGGGGISIPRGAGAATVVSATW